MTMLSTPTRHARPSKTENIPAARQELKQAVTQEPDDYPIPDLEIQIEMARAIAKNDYKISLEDAAEEREKAAADPNYKMKDPEDDVYPFHPKTPNELMPEDLAKHRYLEDAAAIISHFEDSFGSRLLKLRRPTKTPLEGMKRALRRAFEHQKPLKLHEAATALLMAFQVEGFIFRKTVLLPGADKSRS